MDVFDQALDEYIGYVDKGNIDAALASVDVGGDLLVARQNVTTALDEISASDIKNAETTISMPKRISNKYNLECFPLQWLD